MNSGQPSRTAQRAALRRAAHQLLDGPDLVLDDPLALPIAGVEDADRYRANLSRGQNDSYRLLRAYLAARSRFMEDHLAAALRRGVRQYILLGAGLDTSPYRLPFPSGTRVFEVDHPATQKWKRQRVRAAGVTEPESLRYVAVDFERQALIPELAEAGFSRRHPAFVAWLGVTIYLTEAAVFKTIEALSLCAPETELVFDYAADGQRLPPRAQAVLNAMRGRMERVGEPWLSFFGPGRLAAELGQRGFGVLEDLDSAGMNQRYFAGREDGLHTEGVNHLLHARLTPRAAEPLFLGASPHASRMRDRSPVSGETGKSAKHCLPRAGCRSELPTPANQPRLPGTPVARPPRLRSPFYRKGLGGHRE